MDVRDQVALAAVQFGAFLGVTTAMRPLHLLGIRSQAGVGGDMMIKDIVRLYDGYIPDDPLPKNASTLTKVSNLFAGNCIGLLKYFAYRGCVSLGQNLTIPMINADYSVPEAYIIAQIVAVFYLSEVAASVAVYPLETIEKRMCIKRKAKAKFGTKYMETLLELWNEGGDNVALKLYSGALLVLPASLLVVLTHIGVDSFAQTNHFLAQNPFVRLGISALISETLRCPFEVVRTRMQTNKNPGGITQTVTNIYSENGILGFYSGAQYSLLHAAFYMPLMTASAVSMGAAIGYY